jgi:uncharacterized protein (DUF433 family)
MSLSSKSARFDAETTSRFDTRRGRLADADRVAFEAFAVTLREELAPGSLLESIYAERVILAAWRLREAVQAERVGVIEGLGADSSDLFGRLAHDLLRQSERAERALRKALDALASVRDRAAWGRAAALDTSVLADADADAGADDAVVSFESDVISTEDVTDDFAGPDETPGDDEPLPHWQDRLVFDENVSADSPTVKGTWVTVSQIVTLIVDGFTWADILRTHPELTEDDLRVCLAFAHEQESDDGRGAYLP